MADSEEKIKMDIMNQIGRYGGNYSNWYVGISENPRDRLFDQHGIDEQCGPWIIRWALSTDIARCIQRYFIEVLGTDGGSGEEDAEARAVYAYEKKSHTDP